MYFILLVFFAAILLTTGLAAASLAPWVPAKKKDLLRIARLANLGDEETFYDLGCGDGRVAFVVANNSNGRVIGLELSLLFYLICLLKQGVLRAKGLRFKFKDIYRENLSNADVVFIFPASRKKLKGRLKAKLENELKPGSRVITYVFPIEGWEPVITDRPANDDIKTYLYER